ncbi:MAG: hypothetical protein CMN84_10000 [Spongiibacteraceae bacterium]|jgi:uncharacterized protein with ParB-like and HNH nuclease domain/predicted transport protein|nr:hypothetical protein [Spongiibacteraceae bacterium]
MQARDVFLTQLMQGPKQFLIPIFQRTYSWTQSNCDQLLSDIVHAGGSHYIQSHFVGSIVLIPSQQTTASIPQWQVIDGQQRLTTISILMTALLCKAKSLKHDVIAATPLEGIRDYFLANAYGGGDGRYKLVLTKGDKQNLFDLVDGKNLNNNGATSNVKNNYDYFFEALADSEIIDTVYQGLQKLKVVEVVLKAGSDDPQAIFESLNSTGVDLSQADLIRNYVLMRQEHTQQSLLYEEQWYPMEKNFGRAYGDKFDRFAQDFITIQLQSNTLLKSRDVYPSFKVWIQAALEQQSIEDVLAYLCRYAHYYCAFSLSQEKDNELKKAFADLRPLVEVATPVVMRFYELYEEAKLSKDDFIEGVKLLGSYVLRRSICDMQTRSLGNTFAALTHKIRDDDPLLSLKVALARFSKNSRFPNDTEFTQALIHRDLYDSRSCRFVLDRLENDSKEQIDTSKFTIEHVMPQNPELHKDWRTMLGTNWHEIQQTWLHRLGNLTLTGYNSEYQDKPFARKKAIKGGFDDSPLRLNRDMRDCSEWNESSMLKRSQRLAKIALKLWPKLEVDSQVLREAELEDKRRQAEGLTVDDVGGLRAPIKKLYQQLEERVLNLDQGVSVIINKKNLTFYTLEPFIQAIPRKNKLAVILALDFDELDEDARVYCSDTSDWSFIANADLKGIYCDLRETTDFDWLARLIRQAYEDALA